ncbi:GCN5-related N-acetyltransferase [Caldalkalibacillus thermarum TA2.A1]|uniref:GCN5-related N-acetyltransferase n=1 Tax=Caldalkalibacillus thermarum (strain TA2.A1) TaxID=986075 RepID=F5LAC9_CALTT|nr:GNAT family N-acetyltransferase [Caldalkalibacillus thermarum]EGL81678.1 GCN5-related N-acetyltransferase [Caldalkalibacillus thermarum TA2.A1]QZT33270.1 GNAT family N-acetyltransferase [Caldalkalibacillus thermarum TA2.A1]
MSSAVVTLKASHYPEVYSFLSQQEPWSIIAFDALLTHGLSRPGHHWFAEVEHGEIKGVIYHHDQLVQICYASFSQHTVLGTFLSKYLSYFITHGEKKQLSWLKKQLTRYESKCLEQSLFVVQSKRTPHLINQPLMGLKNIRFRPAVPADYARLAALYAGSEVEQQVDGQLVWEAVRRGRVIVAEQKQLAGTVMCLKESPRYVLLGGLYVAPWARSQGIASLLGQKMVQHVLKRGKKVCFYYRDSSLTPFYQRADFQPIGYWNSYSFTSKQTMFFNGSS